MSNKWLKKVVLILLSTLATIFLVSLAGCAEASSLDIKQSEHAAQKELYPKFSINLVESMMQQRQLSKDIGADLASSLAPLNYNSKFDFTPTGAFLSQIFPTSERAERINEASLAVIDWLANSAACKRKCNKDFVAKYQSDKSTMVNKLSALSSELIKNEIRNNENYMVYYHGFPNDFRLLQDVIRLIKSFEYINYLSTTYPMRDLAFDDPKAKLAPFLKAWWQEYVEAVKEKGLPIYPTKEFPGEGGSSGLSLFPDSISYAQKYLLSTNLNFFGNITSSLNNSIFFFLNSTSATGLNIVDELIKSSLKPYITNDQKLVASLKALKQVFNQYMAKAGGQLAQIFIRQDVAAKLSYLAWNGGEPMWLDSNTKRLATQINDQGSIRPLNIFWPSKDQVEIIMMPNINEEITKYIYQPRLLVKTYTFMPPAVKRLAASFLNDEISSEKTAIFATRDRMQARIIADPEYFTNEALTTVKIFSVNEPSTESLKSYEQGLYDVIFGVMADFMATADEVADFKAGEFPLKSLFQKTRKE